METTNTIQKQPGSDDEISLRDLILKIREWCRYLVSKWLIIVSAGVLGALLGLIYAYSKKPVYTAATTFVLEEAGGSSGLMGQYSGLSSIAGVDLVSGGGLFQSDNIIQLYKSRTMVQKTLLSDSGQPGKSELLIDRYIAFNNLREAWSKKPDLKSINFNLKPGQQFTRVQDSITGKIAEFVNKDNLFVSKPDKKLSIIKVEVKSEDEFFSKSFNDQIVKNVNDFYVQTKTKKSLENVEILQHQTDSVRQVLNGAIFQTAAVADATPNLNPTRQVLRAPAQRSQFNAEANKAILTQLVQNLEMSKLSLRKETPLIQVVDHPIFPLQKERFGKAKGIIIGGTIAGFFVVIFLLIKKLLKESLI